MQLNKFTDFGFRVLLYLAQANPNETHTIGVIADDLEISQNHLVKVVHHMAKKGWLITSRGKGGGVILASHALDLKVGNIIQDLEANISLVECNVPPCVLRSNCVLKFHLDSATQTFYTYLNQYTLKQMLRKRPNDYRNKIDLQNLS